MPWTTPAALAADALNIGTLSVPHAPQAATAVAATTISSTTIQPSVTDRYGFGAGPGFFTWRRHFHEKEATRLAHSLKEGKLEALCSPPLMCFKFSQLVALPAGTGGAPNVGQLIGSSFVRRLVSGCFLSPGHCWLPLNSFPAAIAPYYLTNAQIQVNNVPLSRTSCAGGISTTASSRAR